jgi:alkylation response protein AidB-like acyl-CoA dehydrogenase
VGGCRGSRAFAFQGLRFSLAGLARKVQAARGTIDAVRLFGDCGYVRDAPIEAYVRDAEITRICPGTVHIRRDEIGAILIGEHLSGGDRAAAHTAG